MFVETGHFGGYDIFSLFPSPQEQKQEKHEAKGYPDREKTQRDKNYGLLIWRWTGGAGTGHFITRLFLSICNLQISVSLSIFFRCECVFLCLSYRRGGGAFLYVNSHYKFLNSFGLYIQRLLLVINFHMRVTACFVWWHSRSKKDFSPLPFEASR